MFVKFANRYGTLWTSRLGEHGDWKACEDDWLEELSTFTLTDAINGIKKALVIYKDFPPTQGQLVDLCFKESGVPCEDVIIKLMVDRNFNHPMVKLVYDKVGGRMLTNGRAEEITRKVKAVYSECLATFKGNQEMQWAQLDAVKEQLSLPPVEHPKIASHEERRGFKERMEEFHRMAEEGRAKLSDMKPIEFNPKEIQPGGKQRADYEKHLLSVPEHLVLGIPPRYAYDRKRLLNMREQPELLRKAGFNPNPQGNDNEPPRRSNGPQKVNKSWRDD